MSNNNNSIAPYAASGAVIGAIYADSHRSLKNINSIKMNMPRREHFYRLANDAFNSEAAAKAVKDGYMGSYLGRRVESIKTGFAGGMKNALEIEHLQRDSYAQNTPHYINIENLNIIKANLKAKRQEARAIGKSVIHDLKQFKPSELALLEKLGIYDKKVFNGAVKSSMRDLAATSRAILFPILKGAVIGAFAVGLIGVIKNIRKNH